MTPKERARLIDKIEYADANLFGGVDLSMSEARSLLCDFKRLDVMEKALRLVPHIIDCLKFKDGKECSACSDKIKHVEQTLGESK